MLLILQQMPQKWSSFSIQLKSELPNSNSNHALIRTNYYMSGLEFLYLSLAGGGGGAAAKNASFKVVSKKNFGMGSPYILTFFNVKKEGKQHLKYVFQLKF